LRTRVRVVVAALLAACAALSAGRASGQESAGRVRSEAGFEELDEETRAAIENGITWLAREQIGGSGRWPSNPTRYQMSITALAGLALLAHGDTPDSGVHARAVRKAVEWVLDSQVKDGKWQGLIFDQPIEYDQNGLPRRNEEDRPMHGHGFALLFLSEAYGQTREPRLRQRLHEGIALACRLTERSVSPEGGWFYHPFQARDEGSVTITQIQGLRSARDAGVAVDKGTIDRAVEYIKNSQSKEHGGVRYMLRWGDYSPALTAAGISVLHGAGQYHGEAIEKGYQYLRQHLSTNKSDPSNKFFFYTHLYAAQAMFQRGGPEWQGYFPRIRRELLDLRKGAHSWDSDFGRAYGTANALLILQIPLRYLPIFQR
jgi:hypothetical protein